MNTTTPNNSPVSTGAPSQDPSNTPASSSNTPASSSNTPASSSNTPASSSNTPASSSNTPASSSNTPASSSNTPASSSNTPPVSSKTGMNNSTLLSDIRPRHIVKDNEAYVEPIYLLSQGDRIKVMCYDQLKTRSTLTRRRYRTVDMAQENEETLILFAENNKNFDAGFNQNTGRYVVEYAEGIMDDKYGVLQDRSASNICPIVLSKAQNQTWSKEDIKLAKERIDLSFEIALQKLKTKKYTKVAFPNILKVTIDQNKSVEKELNQYLKDKRQSFCREVELLERPETTITGSIKKGQSIDFEKAKLRHQLLRTRQEMLRTSDTAEEDRKILAKKFSEKERKSLEEVNDKLQKLQKDKQKLDNDLESLNKKIKSLKEEHNKIEEKEKDKRDEKQEEIKKEQKKYDKQSELIKKQQKEIDEVSKKQKELLVEVERLENLTRDKLLEKRLSSQREELSKLYKTSKKVGRNDIIYYLHGFTVIIPKNSSKKNPSYKESQDPVNSAGHNITIVEPWPSNNKTTFSIENSLVHEILLSYDTQNNGHGVEHSPLAKALESRKKILNTWHPNFLFGRNDSYLEDQERAKKVKEFQKSQQDKRNKLKEEFQKKTKVLKEIC